MTTPDKPQPINTALLSVSDKTGIVDFAKALAAKNIVLLSTGGTAKLLAEAGIAVTQVAEVTGMAEMMDGRVKTLHPAIHGGILARRDNDQHVADMKAHGIAAIDLVVINLYPFADTLKRPDASRDDLVENIDIGGPAMIRAAAKNHDFVTICTDAKDYAKILDDIDTHHGITEPTRRQLAARAFAHTAAYDSMISAWMTEDQGQSALTPEISLAGTADMVMRYGENPHQEAVLYRMAQRLPRPGVMTAELIQGKALSYNNINDTDAAFELVAEYDRPAIAIIKHANPCGVAMADHLMAAWEAALASDPVSAFGGIIALNRPLTADLATAMTSLFTEVIIAPEADDAAKAILAKKPSLRLMLTGGMPNQAPNHLMIKTLAGGFLAQNADAGQIAMADLCVVTKRQPDAREWADMMFAWKVAKHVKSNAIVYAKDEATKGIGAGQMSRLDAARIAIAKAADMAVASGMTGNPLAQSAVASDAFFPFADGLIAAADAGVSAVIQPGGSIRDDEVIAAADERDLTMVFTGMRHFRH
ncbi:MAG: bifunctional phosphoribosylaminoimidazolecarboxamide formyltransferase/IMP cyclohydrolase [Alphaproteobacteria bacterium]|nr:bifunctional phosphoribosylaminoimidazolecarboxamide formyltransferase/IMP cyclohydrolase [Alphaproteobacteria bacterium]